MSNIGYYDYVTLYNLTTLIQFIFTSIVNPIETFYTYFLFFHFFIIFPSCFAHLFSIITGIGEIIEGYVERVRDDGKIDVSIRSVYRQKHLKASSLIHDNCEE